MLAPQWCNKNGTAAAPEFDEDDPTVSDGCIPHNDDFLQYYLGAYIYASPGKTFDDEAGRPFGSWAARAALRGPVVAVRRDGGDNQDHSATFVVTSSILDPDQYPLYADSRSAADWLRPGPRRSARTAARSTWPRARLVLLQAARQGARPERPDRPAARVQVLRRHGRELGLGRVEARDVTDDPNSDAWTTLPEVDTDGAAGGHEPHHPEHRRFVPGGAGEQVHPQLAHYWTVNPADAEDGCDPTGTTGEWNAFTGSSGGWKDWTVDLSAYAGGRSSSGSA